jgi:hypothetical protein
MALMDGRGADADGQTRSAVSFVNSLTRASSELAAAPMRGATAVREAGAAIERRTRDALASAAEQATGYAIDTVLDKLLAEETVDRIFERVETAGLARRVADRLLEDGIAEQIAERALAGPELGRVVASVIQSELVEESVACLLETQALWILVDEIARSPSVTEAITHQGTGFVDQVTESARGRSREADAWVQRVARRVGRRRDKGAAADGPDLSLPAQLPGGDA